MLEVGFDAANLLEVLEGASFQDIDELAFGLVVMDRAGDVVFYNADEAARAGLSADRVIGRNFFESVGPCTNNYLVAQRFLDEPDLDEFVDFVFTLRMAPTPVRLRMMASAGSPRQYLAVLDR